MSSSNEVGVKSKILETVRTIIADKSGNAGELKLSNLNKNQLAELFIKISEFYDIVDPPTEGGNIVEVEDLVNYIEKELNSKEENLDSQSESEEEESQESNENQDDNEQETTENESQNGWLRKKKKSKENSNGNNSEDSKEKNSETNGNGNSKISSRPTSLAEEKKID